MKFNSIRGKLLSLIAVGMMIVAAVVLYGFNSAWQSIGLFEQVIVQEVDNERQITHMALDFKKQVQEWKNVLLRGADSKQLEKYWGRFEKTEAAIQTAGSGLQQRLDGQTKQLRVLTEHPQSCWKMQPKKSANSPMIRLIRQSPRVRMI